jgi:CRP-like cAMP-binding protein
MLGSDKMKRMKDQGNIIFKSRFLVNLSKVERYEFLQLCHRRSYTEGEFIFHQGDPGTGMYFIEDGQVQLITDMDSENEYSHSIGSPESFGVLSIGYEFRRLYTAQCRSDSTLLGFFKPDFETLKMRQPFIAVKFMETMAMLSMRQLSVAINELREHGDAKNIISRQFDAYYSNNEDQKEGIF